ncbi:unnamed protein product, partial [Gadus morhua 'NCC']
RPRVSLLQRSPSSPVVCHATGFYPDRVVVFWRRDGQELHEQVDPGEVLPNHDGTFQVSVDLDLTAVPQEDWGRYECVWSSGKASRTSPPPWTPPSSGPTGGRLGGTEGSRGPSPSLALWRGPSSWLELWSWRESVGTGRGTIQPNVQQLVLTPALRSLRDRNIFWPRPLTPRSVFCDITTLWRMGGRALMSSQYITAVLHERNIYSTSSQ